MDFKFEKCIDTLIAVHCRSLTVGSISWRKKIFQKELLSVWKCLIFIAPCIANIFTEYNQQDATCHNFFISVRRFACFRRFFRPSSGAQNCTYSVRYCSDKYLTLYVQFWAPYDGRKNRLKHVERLTEIKKLWNVASCWLYSANMRSVDM